MKAVLTLFTLFTCCAFANTDTFDQEEMQLEQIGDCGCDDCKCTPDNHCGCMAKPKPRCECENQGCPCNRNGHQNDSKDNYRQNHPRRSKRAN